MLSISRSILKFVVMLFTITTFLLTAMTKFGRCKLIILVMMAVPDYGLDVKELRVLRRT